MFDLANSLYQDGSINENTQQLDLVEHEKTDETTTKIIKYAKEQQDKKEVHQLYMSGGEREKTLVKERLFLYGKYLPEVTDAFSISKCTQKMNTIRKIQRMTCEKFNLHTDRAAWRTKTGAKAWFCMHWTQIKDYIINVVHEINNEDNKNKISHCSPIIYQNAFNSSCSSSPCISASSSNSSLSTITVSDTPKNVYTNNDKINNNVNSPIKYDETIEKLFPDNIIYYFDCGDFDFI